MVQSLVCFLVSLSSQGGWQASQFTTYSSHLISVMRSDVTFGQPTKGCVSWGRARSYIASLRPQREQQPYCTFHSHRTDLSAVKYCIVEHTAVRSQSRTAYVRPQREQQYLKWHPIPHFNSLLLARLIIWGIGCHLIQSLSLKIALPTVPGDPCCVVLFRQGFRFDTAPFIT